MDIDELQKIVKHLTEVLQNSLSDNKELKKQLDVVEDILHSYLPIVGSNNKEKNEDM